VAEQGTFNPFVVGSNPTRLATRSESVTMPVACGVGTSRGSAAQGGLREPTWTPSIGRWLSCYRRAVCRTSSSCSEGSLWRNPLLTSIDVFDAPDRTFQVWFYTVGMRRLILRSEKDKEHPTRIDVLLQGVTHLKLPTLMVGLSIRRASPTEQSTIEQYDGVAHGLNEHVYVLQGQNYTGYVVGMVMAVHEDALEYFDPSGVIEDVLMPGAVGTRPGDLVPPSQTLTQSDRALLLERLGELKAARGDVERVDPTSEDVED
jgi:hypothetical protein